MLDRLTASKIIENLGDITALSNDMGNIKREDIIHLACVTVMLTAKEIPFEELTPKAQEIARTSESFLKAAL